MPVTHQKIADKLGISRALVTHALNGTANSRISAESRAEIERVARQLNYSPRSRTTHNIGYVSSFQEMKLDTENSLLLQFEDSVRAQGYRLLLASYKPGSYQELGDMLNAKTVDGIILNRWLDGTIARSIPSQVPWVLISDEYGIDKNVDMVALDTVGTARNAVRYLIEAGHKKIVLVIGTAQVKFHDGIIEGSRQAFVAAGLPENSLRMIRTLHIEDIGGELLPMMRSSDAPTAVLCTSPGQAMSVQYSLRSEGYRIPRDVSTMCLVDHERLRALPPHLTTTNALSDKYVEAAVNRLMAKIKNPLLPPEQRVIAGEVVERESVGNPSASRGKN